MLRSVKKTVEHLEKVKTDFGRVIGLEDDDSATDEEDSKRALALIDVDPEIQQQFLSDVIDSFSSHHLAAHQTTSNVVYDDDEEDDEDEEQEEDDDDDDDDDDDGMLKVVKMRMKIAQNKRKMKKKNKRSVKMKKLPSRKNCLAEDHLDDEDVVGSSQSRTTESWTLVMEAAANSRRRIESIAAKRLVSAFPV